VLRKRSAYAIALLTTATVVSTANPFTASLRRVQVLDGGVRVELDRRVEPRIYSLLNPSRLVLDFDNTVHPGGGGRWPGRGSEFSRARSSQFDGGVTPVTRVVLDLEANVVHRGFWNGPHFTLLLERDVELDLRDALAPLAPALFTTRPRPSPMPAPRSLVRRYPGELRDRAGRPMTGNYLLRFRAGEWSEAIYVQARDGRFVARLGNHRPLPERYRETPLAIEVFAPQGTGWRVSLGR